MGDYRNHSSETGKSLCGSFADVQAAGRDKGAASEDVLGIERELKRLDHYKTRFIAHRNSVTHSIKARDVVHDQIMTCIELNPDFNPMDFQFLNTIHDLIITVRRSLAYTYAMRYYLTGPCKQTLFDFMQQ